MQDRISHSDFVKAVSKKTGYNQKKIATIFKDAAEIVLQNLNEGISTTVFNGMIVYPAKIEDKYTFPRARFGRYFKMSSSVS